MKSVAYRPFALAAIVIAAQLSTPAAQERQTLAVAAHSTARSPMLDLVSGDEMVVQVAADGPGEAVIAAYVYDAQSVLICRDEPGAQTDTLRCPVAVAGRYYYVLLENTSAVGGVARIEGRRSRAPAGPAPNYAVQRVFFATNVGRLTDPPFFGP
jgi:hypothetical protein